ncbi:MAG: glycoside hydrolase family 15 protein [Alphaproteobacteria bacterium]
MDNADATLDLAAIGNSTIAALIDRHARVVWACFPRLDGDPLFASLLDTGGKAGGFFDIVLDGDISATQAYRINTAIVETTLSDGNGGIVRVTDFAPRFRQFGRVYRPAMLVRRIEPVAGAPRLCVRLRPRFAYGAEEPARTFGSNHVRYVGSTGTLRLYTDAPISYIAEERPFMLDRPVTLMLGPDESLTASLTETARRFLEQTQEYWQDWCRFLSVPFEWQEAVIRAAITLKLCSFEETGAIVAALTTSISEAPNTQRNWDYRYCWLRDAYFVVQALNRLSATQTMEEYIRYITNVAALDPHGTLGPVYAVVPGRPLVEEGVATALSGYRGMGPVRVGNAAAGQIQNDSYGSVVLAAAQMFFDQRLPRRGDTAMFQRLEILGERAADAALRPDAGLWEFRTRAGVHTYSAVMCWAACDRLSKIARALGLAERGRHWHDVAAPIRAAILEQAYDKTRNTFVSSFGGGTMDASLLLLHELGFLSADDPRFLGTLDAIEKTLRHGDHLYRYTDADDFGAPETSFVVCTFWYIDALAAVGRKDEARAIFERLLARRNHLGLLSEDLDPRTGDLWGNFPQTYSMVGLIVSAMRLSKSWEEAFWRGS